MGQFDQDCNARLYSRTLYAMGHKEAALQLLINESQIVQRAFGVGAGGAAVTSRGLVYAGQGAQRGPAPCTKWRNDVVGLQCLY